MPFQDMEKMPESSRLWAFNTGQELTEEQKNQIEEKVHTFLSQWAAHGSALTAGYQIIEDRFLLVAVDQDVTAPSGCSIDAMTRFLRDLGVDLGLDFLDAPPCCYRDGDAIVSVSREEFARAVESGALTNETRVFDLTVPTIGALLAGGFERDFAGSWYERAFVGVSA